MMRRFLLPLLSAVAIICALPTNLLAETFTLQPMFNITGGEMKPNVLYLNISNDGGRWSAVFEAIGVEGDPIAVENIVVVREGDRIMFSLEDDETFFIDRKLGLLAIQSDDQPQGWLLLTGMADFDDLYPRIRNLVENGGALTYNELPAKPEPEPQAAPQPQTDPQTGMPVYSFCAVDYGTSVLGWDPAGESRMMCEETLRQAGLNFCDNDGYLVATFASGSGDCDNPLVLLLNDAPRPESTALYLYYGSATNVYRWNFSFDSITGGVRAKDAEYFFNTACRQFNTEGYPLQQVSNPPPFQQVMTTQINGHKVSVGIFRADHSAFVYIDYDK